MVTHECIISYSTCRGVGGQVPVVVSYTTGQYLDIVLTTVQCGIYCPGGSFDLRHR